MTSLPARVREYRCVRARQPIKGIFAEEFERVVTVTEQSDGHAKAEWNKDKGQKPRIVMTLLVRDEEDIIAENIEFHRAWGVDHFIITDNLSVDRTPDIILEYVRLGFVTPIFESADDYSQSVWVTRMARMAASELAADWVINCDADEFWITQHGDLKDFFASLDPISVGAVSVQRHDLALVPVQNRPWHQEMVYRKAKTLNHMGKPLPPKAAHRADAKVVVHQGNHAVEGIGGTVLEASELEILHFPIRSVDQFENKIKNGGRAYRRNTTLPVAIGDGWRKLYAEYQEKGTLNDYVLKNSYDPDHLMRCLAAGELIRDLRIASFFGDDQKPRRALAHGEPVCDVEGVGASFTGNRSVPSDKGLPIRNWRDVSLDRLAGERADAYCRARSEYFDRLHEADK